MTTANFPGGLTTYTDKVDGVDIVKAADVNSLQAEVAAIEAELGVNPSDSAIGATGSYVPNPTSGTFDTVSNRIKNIEAGLTASSSDGSRIGYTLLASGNFTSAPGAISVTGSSYVKFVVVINCVTQHAVTPAQVSMTLNATSSGYKYAYTTYSGTPTTAGSGGNPYWNIGAGATLQTGFSILAEIHNVANAGRKHVSFYADTGAGTGSVDTGAVTSITIASATANYPVAATYAIYGVK